MAFAITCNKCGGKQTFKENDTANQEKIGLAVNTTDWGEVIESIDIYCENKECDNWISIDY